MRLIHHRLSLVAPLAGLLLLAAFMPLLGRPEPASAQISQGGSFGSAVPCLLAEDSFATTCFADTIFSVAPASDPALAQVGLSTKSPLASLGARSGGTNTRIANGIGSVYGLAYDDGAVSGIRRLFVAAYTKRLTSFGPGGPGGVYAFDLATRSWSLAFTVPGAGWERTRANDLYDSDAIAQVGLSGLGDMEISPDGRELFVVNIGARRIERYSITAATPVRRTPISIDDGVRDTNDALDAIWAPYRTGTPNSIAQEQAARVDTVPFALEFYPAVTADGPLLMLGLTDTARRGVQFNGTDPPRNFPAIHLAVYRLNGTQAQRWAYSLTQDLTAPGIADRMAGSHLAGLWASPPYNTRDVRGWNPWHNSLATMPRYPVAGLGDTIEYPQPLLTDIEFTHDAKGMFLGLRDRTGDQVLAAEAPAGQFSAIAQGDTLAYRLAGSAWALQSTGRSSDAANADPDDAFVTPARSDYFDDNRHRFDPNIAPFHIENHGGALATTLQGSANALTERVATTSLLGNRQSGIAFYGQGGNYWSSNPNTLVTASRYAGGKAAALGDLEPLCTYAFVSGRVWDDRNANGIQDSGEPGMANVRLEAFRGSPLNPADATAITDASGAYRFALPPNTAYNIRIAAADRAPGGRVSGYFFSRHNYGGDDLIDSDASTNYGYIELAGSLAAPTTGVTGAAITTPVREQELSNVDIGLNTSVPTGSLGDRVWEDRNANGRQDSGEPGLPTALLNALSITLVPDPQTATILPPAFPVSRSTDGRYFFNSIPPGRYAVRFGNLPAGYSVAPLQASGSDGTDSDASPASGMQTRFIIIGDPPQYANFNINLDLGLVPSSLDVAVSLNGTPTVLVGQPIDYTVTASNLSAGSTAQGVVLTHDLPLGTTFVSATGSPARVGRRLTWTIRTLTGGQSRSYIVRVTAPATMSPPVPPQALTSNAQVVTTSAETSTANNSASFVTQLVRPELSIVKSDSADPALVGDELLYTLTYTNRGSTPASNVVVADTLPAGLSFTRFVQNPGGACSYLAASRTVRCAIGTLGNTAPANTGSVVFGVRADTSAPDSLSNTASITTATTGDDPSDNSDTELTALARPNPGLSVTIRPGAPFPVAGVPAFPVATNGAIEISFGNGLNPPPAGETRGLARGATLSVDLSAGNFVLGPLPAGCTYLTPRISCALGDLAPGAAGTLRFPITLPANFSADQLDAAASIATLTPERPADQADNSGVATISVVRPNVFVDAAGPASIVGQGSVFWYTLDYGNLHRRSPALTRDAADVVLEATLPAEVSFVEASVPPTLVDGQTLRWELGTLAPRQLDRITVVVQTAIPAGETLRLDTTISTSTPGDDPADNADSVITAVVQPPAIAPSNSDLRLAIRSELDPNSQDSNPTNGVYLSDGGAIAWPAGEVLDFTPRLRDLSFANAPLPFPYEYRARVVGWSIGGFTVNGRTLDPADADSRWLSGCRPGAAPNGTPTRLSGCTYGYIGGDSLEAIHAPETLREEQLRDQAHVYWTQPPAPPMRDDVYLYTLEPLSAAQIGVEVEVEVWIVNAYPGEIDGVPLPEIPVQPLPDPERQLIAQTFDVTLLAPRSVVGPGVR